MPHRQMKDPPERHVVSKKPLHNSMNQMKPPGCCEVALPDAKKSTVSKRKGGGRRKRAQIEEVAMQPEESHAVVAPPVSSKSIAFHRRPGYGQAGSKCIVKANHFLTGLPDKDLFQYDVTITPEVSSRVTNRAIIAQLVKLHRESSLGMRLPAYDGRKSLYTAGALPFLSKEFHIKLVDDEDGMSIVQ